MRAGRWASNAASLLTLAASIAGVSAARGWLAPRVSKVKETSDAYPLPPPEQMPVVSLGYRAAAADILWAYVLVAQGLRMHDHRRFDFGARYFQTIFTLDPTYRAPYLLLDTILTFGSVRATADDARATRAMLEQGMSARPSDAKLFLEAGYFIAYIGPGYLPEAERQEWRVAGATVLRRAAELGAGQENLEAQAISGASILNREGERDAAVAFLERAYALSESDENRGQILAQLASLKADQAAERARLSAARFDETWRGELPFVSRTKILLLGPRPDTAHCAGAVGAALDPRCAADWSVWSKMQRSSEP